MNVPENMGWTAAPPWSRQSFFPLMGKKASMIFLGAMQKFQKLNHFNGTVIAIEPCELVTLGLLGSLEQKASEAIGGNWVFETIE